MEKGIDDGLPKVDTQELTTKIDGDFRAMMLHRIQNSLVTEKKEPWHGKKTREPLLTNNTAGFLSFLLEKSHPVQVQLAQIKTMAEENDRLSALRKLTTDLSSGVRFAYHNPGKFPAEGTLNNTDRELFTEGVFVWTVVTDPEKAMKMFESQTSGILVTPDIQKQELQIEINKHLPIIQAARSQAVLTQVQVGGGYKPFRNDIFPNPASYVLRLDNTMENRGFRLAYQPPLHLRV